MDTHLTASDSAAEERRNTIPSLPKQSRDVELAVDGTFEFLVPDGQFPKSWAKLLTGVNTSQKGGYALQGQWRSCGRRYNDPLGSVIAVGSKRPTDQYVSDYTLFVLTSIRLIPVKQLSRIDVEYTNWLMELPVEDRVETALKSLLKRTEGYLTELACLDREEYVAELSLIAERTEAWLAMKAKIERALEGGDIPVNIADIDSASLAIVKAGYRELAMRYHPDRGGSPEVMVLLNNAKRQLNEMLSMVKGGK